MWNIICEQSIFMISDNTGKNIKRIVCNFKIIFIHIFDSIIYETFFKVTAVNKI